MQILVKEICPTNANRLVRIKTSQFVQPDNMSSTPSRTCINFSRKSRKLRNAIEEKYTQKNKVKHQLSKAPANPHLPSTLLAQKVKGLTARLLLKGQCSGFVSSLQLPRNECQDAWVTSPASPRE